MPLDPVCRKIIQEKEIKATAEFEGKTYYFCCPSCREQFIQNPKKHIGANWLQRFLFRLAESNAEQFGGSKPSCHG